METPLSDAELGALFRSKAEQLGYSPNALLSLTEAVADHMRWAVMPNFPPFPNIDREETLGRDHLAEWPDWTGKLIPEGSRIERLVWPDGTIAIRLVSPRGLVLARYVE